MKLSAMKVGQKIKVRAQAVSPHDQSILKKYHDLFRRGGKFSSELFHAREMVLDAKKMLEGLDNKEDWLNDNLAKMAYKFKDIIEIYARTEQDFIDIFSKEFRL